MQRKASARWQGTAKEGTGSISTQSGTLKDTPYSFVARFGDGKGTNPEELVAAAHAGCFTDTAVELHLAAARLELPEDAVEQRRLAAAVRTDDAENLAFIARRTTRRRRRRSRRSSC